MRPRHRPASPQGLPNRPNLGNGVTPTLRQRGTTMTPDTSRWRSSETYDYLDELDSPDLAWEWLRRNAEYQKDYAEADSPSLKSKLQKRWGLQFFRPAVAECWQGSGVLGRRGGHERRTTHARARHPAGGWLPLHRVARNSRALGRPRRAFPPRRQWPHNSVGPSCWRPDRHSSRGACAA